MEYIDQIFEKTYYIYKREGVDKICEISKELYYWVINVDGWTTHFSEEVGISGLVKYYEDLDYEIQWRC
jgi:hypothetical protein